jgi:hypothetical protein
MLSTGEWIRNKKFQGLLLNKNNDVIPVFPSGFQPEGITPKSPSVSTNFSVGSVKNLKTTGVSRIRNVASDRTSLIALRTTTFLSKTERVNPDNGFVRNIPATSVSPLCGCQSGTVEKVGLCPSCRNL